MVRPGLENPGLPVPSDKRDTRSIKQVFAHLCVAQMKQNIWILFNEIFFIPVGQFVGGFWICCSKKECATSQQRYQNGKQVQLVQDGEAPFQCLYI